MAAETAPTAVSGRPRPMRPGSGVSPSPEGRGRKMAEEGKAKTGPAAAPTGPAGGGGAAKPLTPEQVVAGFNRLRQEQRGLASKAAELEMELNEHKLVIETLREVDPSRKCFRMVGGVLVERTVKEVLPALENNKDQINKIIETLSQQLQTKGRELNEFREKHNIRLMGEEEQKPPAKESPEGAAAKSSSAGVLVS
ncbi:prefoldin subunit 2 [Erythrolamprus reginae]|uniref:prefoldin subunit 2 n=1 Tax=Erythrolamprus reginae TaxID=121349 RepID=UPI00396C7B4A